MADDIVVIRDSGSHSLARVLVEQHNNLAVATVAPPLPFVLRGAIVPTDLLVGGFTFVDENGEIRAALAPLEMPTLPTFTVDGAAGKYGTMTLAVDSGTGELTLVAEGGLQTYITKELALAAATLPEEGTQTVVVCMIEVNIAANFVANTDDLIPGGDIKDFVICGANDPRLPSGFATTDALAAAAPDNPQIIDRTLDYLLPLGN